MSNVFCGQCGVQANGGNFCRSCGAPLAPAAPAPTGAAAPEPTVPLPPFPQPPTQQPLAPQPPTQQPLAPQQPAQQPAPSYPAYSPAPAAPMVNPFAGITLTDVARDLGALILLFGALAVPWDISQEGFNDGSGRWWVVIATLISALSVGVPYLVRLNLVAGWGGPQSRLVKYVCAVPYLACVVAALINHLIHVDDDFIGLIGPGVAVGLAGALLAAQARGSDEEPTGAADSAWRLTVFVLLGGGVAVVAVTVLIDMALSFSDTPSVSGLIGRTVLVLGSYVVVVALPFVGFLNGGREWGRVLAGAGFGIVVTQFFGGIGEEDTLFAASLESVKNTFGIFLIAAGAAVLVSRPVQRRLVVLPTIPSWVQTARHASTVLGTALAVSAVARLLLLIAAEETRGTEIVVLVLLVVAAGAAFLIGAQLAGDPDRARRLVVGLAGGILMLAIVTIAVGRSGDGVFVITAAETIGWFVMPGLILFSLLYPEEIRRTFQPIAGVPQEQQPPSGGFPPLQPPVAPSAPPAPPAPPTAPPPVPPQGFQPPPPQGPPPTQGFQPPPD